MHHILNEGTARPYCFRSGLWEWWRLGKYDGIITLERYGASRVRGLAGDDGLGSSATRTYCPKCVSRLVDVNWDSDFFQRAAERAERERAEFKARITIECAKREALLRGNDDARKGHASREDREPDWLRRMYRDGYAQEGWDVRATSAEIEAHIKREGAS